MAAFNAALTRWRQCVGELGEIDLQRYIGGIGEFSESIAGCFGQVDALHRTASAIRKRERVRNTAPETGYLLPVPDLDSVVAVKRQVCALILASLLVIYLPPVPTSIALIAISSAFAMMCAAAPQIPGAIATKPAFIGLVFSGVVYMTVLPALEGFLQFSIVLFLSCFVLSYLIFNPVSPLSRLLATVMMICIITGDNPLTYSFDYWIGWIVAMFLMFAVTAVTWRFPASVQPDAQFRWQYRRLRTFSERLNELLTLCDDVANRHPGLELLEAVSAPGSGGATPHDALRATVAQLADDPAGLDLESCLDYLERAGAALETSVSDMIEQATEAGAVSREALLELYRVLGAWRGLLYSASSLSECAGAIDWVSLHRERF